VPKSLSSNVPEPVTFEEQDKIEQKREDMILAMEDLLQQGHQVSVDFVCEWRLA
jgi:hypothetical protein